MSVVRLAGEVVKHVCCFFALLIVLVVGALFRSD